MKYTLDTPIQFLISLNGEKITSVDTMESLGFSQDELDKKSTEEIETELQEMYEDWERNYLDSGWSIFKS